MAEYDNAKWQRPLPFPLAEPEYPEYTDTNDGAVSQPSISIFPPDFPDEKIDLHLRMSMSEFTAIASAIDVGRDIAFGERSYELWRTWIKALIGVVTVNCDDVADCIDTSEAVQVAIANNEYIMLANALSVANNGINNPLVEANTDTIHTLVSQGSAGNIINDEIKPLENCNLDKLWAGIRDGIVQRLDDNARSMLEFLVSKADGAERANALIGAIPIFGSMAQAVLEQMIEAAPDMLNLFEAYSSIEHMDEIACEIFGMVCAECRYPTIEEVYTYYALFGITGIGDLDDLVIAAATDLLFGSTETAALAFYHTMICYQMFVLLMGSKFHGLSGSNAIYTLASLGEDFANDNWEILCDSCDDAYARYTWDFENGQQNTYVGSGFSNSGGSFIGDAWAMTAINATTGFLSLCVPLDTNWRIRAIGIKTNQASGSNNLTFMGLRPTRATQTGATGLAPAWGTTGWTFFVNGLASLTGMRELGMTYSQALSSNAQILAITIIFDKDYAPDGAVRTSVQTLSATVYP